MLLTLARSSFCLCNLPTRYCFTHYDFNRQPLKQHTSFLERFCPLSVEHHATLDSGRSTGHVTFERREQILKRSRIIHYSVSQNWRYWFLKAFWMALTWEKKKVWLLISLEAEIVHKVHLEFHKFDLSWLFCFSLTVTMSVSLQTLPCVLSLYIALNFHF